MHEYSFALVATLMIACPAAAAAEIRSLRAEPLGPGEAIVIDGSLDEPAWRRAAVATDFIQQEPQQGAPASERTEARVAFDGANLYVGFICRIDPAQILTTSLVRDFNQDETDTAGMILSPFNDHRNGFLFVVTPDGAQRDTQAMNDGANINADWNVVWDVRTRRTADGWTAEVVIPFRSLRFPTFGGSAWGINFNRKIRSRNETSFWNEVRRPHKLSRVSSSGELTGVQTPGAGHDLKFTPYALGRSVSAGGHLDPDLQGGADLKYGLSSGTTLDLTLNTDFSEVEVDARQVNLTRFPLFYPEKRPFFLESADLFHFGIRPIEKGGGPESEEYVGFFSRRIGLASDGTPLPLWGGARLTGRSGQNAFGLLQVSTREKGAVPAAHYTVGRFKRNIFGQSDAGVIVMNRQGAGGDRSRVAGADMNLQFGRVNLTSFLARSSNPQEKGKRTHASKLFAGYASSKFDAFLATIDVGDGYDRTMSFVPRRDIRVVRGEVNWHWRPKVPLVREFHPHISQRRITTLDSDLRTKRQHVGMWVYFHDGARVEFFQNRSTERLERPFEISRGVVLPVGDYTFNTWQTNLFSDQSRTLSGRVVIQWGEFWNGTLNSVSATASLRLRPRFLLEGHYERNAVELRQGKFDTHLGSLRVHKAFSTRQFFDLLVQYSSQDDVFGYQGRYNLIHRPLSDLFVVLSEQREYFADRRVRSFAIKFNRMLDF